VVRTPFTISRYRDGSAKILNISIGRRDLSHGAALVRGPAAAFSALVYNARVTFPTLILASRSPRRACLLRQAGYAFTVAEPPFADPPAPPRPGPGEGPEQVAMQLAAAKARSLLEHRSANAVILAADTIVVVGEGERCSFLGQPQSRDQAQAMLDELLNATHRVITGVTLAGANGAREERFCDVAEVTFGAVDNQMRTSYLDSGCWRGKAGGYNVQELESTWPITVKGDRTTVIGLPMMKLVQALAAWSVHPASDVHDAGVSAGSGGRAATK